LTEELAAPSMGSFVPWWGDYGPGRPGERADGGGMLPDVSEASTAIYTEGISPLDTWRSGSSEARSVSDLQDLAVSLPSAARFQTYCSAGPGCLAHARVCAGQGKHPARRSLQGAMDGADDIGLPPFLCRWSRRRLPLWPNLNARDSTRQP
jgi:hypothetical protein